MKPYVVALALLAACATPAPPASALADVARVHGGAGPWAVAGYRMGAYALQRLGLPRGSFDLDVVHESPRAVQYTCVADGAQAATGASIGKLNLALVEATADDMRTVFTNKKTGASITLRLTQSFRQRFLDVPRAELGAAGREVMALADADIFEEAQAARE